MSLTKKISLSSLSGFCMLALTYVYINSNFTIQPEDSLYKSIAFYAFKLFSATKQAGQEEIRFINTAHDLALVRDTGMNNGVVPVTDRAKLAGFLEELYKYKVRPKFIVVDLEFYYPFVTEKDSTAGFVPSATDKRLQDAMNKFSNLSAPVALAVNGRPIPAVVSSRQPGIVAFTTYGDFLTKFQLSYQSGKYKSIPLILYQQLSGNMLPRHNFLNISRGKLWLNNISPYYYLTDDITREAPGLDDLAGISAAEYAAYDGKIILIGNFNSDKAQTALGEMPGTVVLANIYLTLKNGHDRITLWWPLLMFLIFTLLSYLAWFKKMPKFNLRLKVIFSEQLAKFINNYCSYFGVMLLVSVLSFWIFHIFVNILFSSLIFSTIEFITNKNYRSDHV